MDGKAFIETWDTVMDPMIKYDREALLRCNISGNTLDELSEFGLPTDASPFLSFEATKELNLSAKLGFPKKFATYCHLGITGNGDLICYDTIKKIFIVIRHEDKMDTTVMNSSLSGLYGSLQCYANFVKEVNETGGQGAINRGNLPQDLIEGLLQELISIDQITSDSNSFWAQEVEHIRRRSNKL